MAEENEKKKRPYAEKRITKFREDDTVLMDSPTQGTGSMETGDFIKNVEEGLSLKGDIVVFDVDEMHGKAYPKFADIYQADQAKKTVVLRVVNYQGLSDSPAEFFYLSNYNAAPNSHSYTFIGKSKIKDVTSSDVWTTANRGTVEHDAHFTGNGSQQLPLQLNTPIDLSANNRVASYGTFGMHVKNTDTGIGTLVDEEGIHLEKAGVTLDLDFDTLQALLALLQ